MTLRWGIIGTGKIAHTFASNLAKSQSGQLVAVASRTRESAESFAQQFSGITAFPDYVDLIAAPSVDVLYISTPHPFHAQWTIKAAEAGKHILCEKPLGMTAAQGRLMQAAAKANGVFLAEAFMYRFHPQTAKLVELLQGGIIGEVRRIRTVFGFDAGPGLDPRSRLLNPELGGGGILDIGCYTVSAARLVAGVAIGKPFDNPVEVTGKARLGKTGVDEEARATLTFASGIIAEVACAVRADLGTLLEIDGTKGSLSVPNPWVAHGSEAVDGQIRIQSGTTDQTLAIPCPSTSYTLEAEAVAAAIAAGKQEPDPPAMTWEDSIGNLETLDAWRVAVGLAGTEPDFSFICRCRPGR